MGCIKQIALNEILPQLSDIIPTEIKRDFSGLDDDLFLCALGFEERTTAIPSLLAESNYRCNEAIYFEYLTNPEDNEINRPELIQSLGKFSNHNSSIIFNIDAFSNNFRDAIARLPKKGDYLKVTFDIGACSNMIVLNVIKILLDYNAELWLVYSEAQKYHPTPEEIEEGKNGLAKESLFLTGNVTKILPSSLHPGWNLDALPEALIAFAAFDPRRTRAVISHVDENLSNKAKDRVIWIIGTPHLAENAWRAAYVKNINEIPLTSQTYCISTLDYKDTLSTLNEIYEDNSSNYHLNISPLGSKMQAIGMALFQYMRPDVTILFAPTKEYNASRYSEGVHANYQINLGKLSEIKRLLDEVGTIQIVRK